GAMVRLRCAGSRSTASKRAEGLSIKCCGRLVRPSCERDGRQQGLIAEWFAQPRHRAQPEQGLPGRLIVLPGDEHDRYFAAGAQQLLAQLEAAHAAQADVEKQAVGMVVAPAREI